MIMQSVSGNLLWVALKLLAFQLGLLGGPYIN